jgi:hypothetical protein
MIIAHYSCDRRTEMDDRTKPERPKAYASRCGGTGGYYGHSLHVGYANNNRETGISRSRALR